MEDQSSNQPPSFEEALARLEEIVRELEEGQVGLAESLARYEEGVKLLRECHGLLEGAERKIMLLSGLDADGNPITVPFEEASEEAASLETKAKTRSRRRSTKPAEPPQQQPNEETPDEGVGLF